MNRLDTIFGKKNTIFFLVLTFTLLANTVFSGTSANDGLFSSPPFANPEETVEMTPEWQRQKLQHPKDVDADLFAIVSYQLFDVWNSWINDFAKKKGISVHVIDGVDGTSAGALRRKQADITCYCGSPKSSDRMPGVNFHTVGVSPVVFYVNTANPINDLSLEMAMKIFRGDTNNWSDVGGALMSIVPVARSHCKKRRGRWRPLNNMDNLSPAAIKVGSVEDALTYVSATPGSIGYEVLPQVDPFVTKGKVKVLTVNGLSPYDLPLLSKGEYPLYRVYTFTTWDGDGLENPLAGEVVDMLTQKTAEKASEIFFVPTVELRKSGWLFQGDELVGEPR